MNSETCKQRGACGPQCKPPIIAVPCGVHCLEHTFVMSSSSRRNGTLRTAKYPACQKYAFSVSSRSGPFCPVFVSAIRTSPLYAIQREHRGSFFCFQGSDACDETEIAPAQGPHSL